MILLSLYAFALATTVRALIRLTFQGHSDLLRRWGGVILMLSAPTIALTFSYTPFNSQAGIQFWLLIGAFEGVSQSRGWNEVVSGNSVKSKVGPMISDVLYRKTN